MASSPRAPTVFVVDDDDAVRDALTTTLTGAGFDAVACPSATRFVEAYRGVGPACLVVELDLPELEVLLRALPPAARDLPVIATTRRLRRRRLPDELAACVGLLEKPFGYDELMALLQAALRPGRDT